MADVVSRESPIQKKSKKNIDKSKKPKEKPDLKIPNKDDGVNLLKDDFKRKLKEVGKIESTKHGTKDDQVSRV